MKFEKLDYFYFKLVKNLCSTRLRTVSEEHSSVLYYVALKTNNKFEMA